MRGGRIGDHKGLVAAALGLQLGFALLVSETYLSLHNSLYNNGRWTATKTELAEGVMGAHAFLFSLQSTYGGIVNLGAWHGHQEIVSRREMDPVSIEVDARLTAGSYLILELNRTAKRFTGIRISRNRLFPPIVFRATDDGRFLRKWSLGRLRRVPADTWLTLGVRLGEDRFTILLDGREVRTVRTPIPRPQRIGFRAGHRPTWIDNVRVVSRDGRVFRDSFSRPRGWLRVYAVASASVLLVSIAALVLLRRFTRVGDRRLLFFFLMFGGVLVVVAGLVYLAAAQRKQYYPDASVRLRLEERYWAEEIAEQNVEHIMASHAAVPGPGIHRLLFVGSSQTRGSGAAEPADTLVRTTERLLNQRADERRFECINTAIHAYRMEDMAREVRRRWLQLEPRTVIVNASNNDLGVPREAFERHLERLVVDTLKAGAQPLLVLEPNSVERRNPAITHYHQVMARVGERHRVPVVDMHRHLAERRDDGLLWWDWVHLSSFGQRLFAEHLVDELVRLGLVDLG